MDTEVDVICFDAYRFSEKVSLYPKELKGFLEKRGILGWEIVPNSGDFQIQIYGEYLLAVWKKKL